MNIVGFLKRMVRGGLDNQTEVINQRLMELVEGTKNQSDLLNRKLEKIAAGLDNQSRLLGDRLEMLIQGIKNQSELLNRKLTAVAEACENHSRAPEQPGRLTLESRSDDLSAAAETGNVEEQGSRVNSRSHATNDLEAFKDVFSGIKPWSGHVPPRFIVDFFGMLIDIKFHPMLFTDPRFNPDVVGGGYEETVIPCLADAKTPGDAEAWFEAVDWVMSAREASGRYVMITLGANYGAQAVGAYRALQAINPLPYKLVAVEPVPGNLEWIRRHMRNNGIDPDQQWIIPSAISDKVEPLFFPVGGPGIGSNNCYSTNERAARQQYAEEFIARKMSAEALRNLLLNNTTGLMKDLVPGQNFVAEIKLISSITLNELLGPFEMVDLLESDIQQSEILVFPPFIDLLRRKVRRIHIGTHGEDVHLALHNLFAENGWEIVFSYRPNSTHESALGNFETNDGVLTVRNPDL